MFQLLHRHGDPVRSELNEMKKLIRHLAASEPQIRFGIGAGICLANAMFLRQFGGMQRFRVVAPGDRALFYVGLSDLESSLRGSKPAMALGVGLYHVWLVGVLAGHQRAAELLGEQLTDLSRRASFSLSQGEY